MSVAEADAAPSQAFSPRTILALVIVGLVSFSALVVLAAYAPELRGATDPGAHALSSSAVGFKGATVMLQAEGVPTVISRAVPHGARGDGGLIVLTPEMDTPAKSVAAFAQQASVLLVLPKWLAAQQPLHPGFVDKVGISETTERATAMLAELAPNTAIAHRTALSWPTLHGAPGGFMAGTFLRPAAIEGWQTLSGDGWTPLIVDDEGAMVLARSKIRPGVMVLSDPDLLNNQGLAHLENARAGLGLLNALRDGQGVRFDVTLNGYARGRGIGRVMLEPPWLAASLCGVAAALLMGLHGLARFGPTLARGRAIALGKRALVDNSAGLVRMARREAELAPAYAALTKALVGERCAAVPADLTAQAERAGTPDELLAVGRRLYHWRLEIMRERR